MKDSSTTCPCPACDDRRQDTATIPDTKPLLNAIDGLLWKLSHNYSASGTGIDSVPSTVTRRDASVRVLVRELARYRDPSGRCDDGGCDWCDTRWCEDGQS